LVHGISAAQSEKDASGKFCGKSSKCLSDNRRMSTDKIRDRYSYSDPSSVGSYRGECRERLGRGRFCGPVEQMIIDEDMIKAVFFAELCSLDYTLEWLSGG
jgi:hypothetical protein